MMEPTQTEKVGEAVEEFEDAREPMPISSPLHESTATAQDASKRLPIWGAIGTAAYLVVIALYVLARSDAVWAMRPQDFADLLAGTIAPLGFFWLVLGFFQQGQELRNSSHALRLQGEELRNSAQQQKELVQVTREQLEHERQRTAAAEEEATRLSQPRLLLTRGGNYPELNTERRRYEFTITNAGAPCTDVRLDYQMERRPDQLPAWQTGERFNFDIRYKEGDFDELPVTVSYVDARGKRQQQVLTIVAAGSTLRACEPD